MYNIRWNQSSRRLESVPIFSAPLISTRLRRLISDNVLRKRNTAGIIESREQAAARRNAARDVGGGGGRATRRDLFISCGGVIRGRGPCKKKKRSEGISERERKRGERARDRLFHYAWLIRTPGITHRPLENYGPPAGTKSRFLPSFSLLFARYLYPVAMNISWTKRRRAPQRVPVAPQRSTADLPRARARTRRN